MDMVTIHPMEPSIRYTAAALKNCEVPMYWIILVGFCMQFCRFYNKSETVITPHIVYNIQVWLYLLTQGVIGSGLINDTICGILNFLFEKALSPC